MRFFSLKSIIDFVVGHIFMHPRMADVTAIGTPPTLSSMNASALQRTMWDRKLNEPDTLLDDPWVRGEITNVVEMRGNKITIPNDVFFQVPTDPSNPHTVRVQAILDLQEAPQEGTSEHMPGNEEGLRLMFDDFVYNEVKKAVKSQGWGIEYEDMNSTGALKMINPLLKKYWAEYRGLQIRKASMLGIEDVLTKAPISASQNLCSNIFICNIAENDMPTWDVTDPTVVAGSVDSLGYYSSKTFGGGSTTYIEAVCDKMIEASGTGASPVADMRLGDIERLWTYLTQYVQMPKAKIGDAMGYLVMLPQFMYDYVTSLTNTDGFSTYIQATYQSPSDDISYLGKLIRYRDMFFACDPRGPTLTLSGSDGAWTLQPGWVNPGNNDDRNKLPWSATSGSVNYVYDVFFVYGGGGIAERVVAPTQYVNETQSYGYLKGRGSYMLRGIQVPHWDIDTPDDANDSNGTSLGKTLIQKSVVMGIASRRTVGSALRATS